MRHVLCGVWQKLQVLVQRLKRMYAMHAYVLVYVWTKMQHAHQVIINNIYLYIYTYIYIYILFFASYKDKCTCMNVSYTHERACIHANAHAYTRTYIHMHYLSWAQWREPACNVCAGHSWRTRRKSWTRDLTLNAKPGGGMVDAAFLLPSNCARSCFPCVPVKLAHASKRDGSSLYSLSAAWAPLCARTLAWCPDLPAPESCPDMTSPRETHRMALKDKANARRFHPFLASSSGRLFVASVSQLLLPSCPSIL
jgi:hypothetical protein